jgi:hypothetical protein
MDTPTPLRTPVESSLTVVHLEEYRTRLLREHDRADLARQKATHDLQEAETELQTLEAKLVDVEQTLARLTGAEYRPVDPDTPGPDSSGPLG